ncbi:transmembrane protein 87B-like protein, partial [Tanacetum coccineum]
FESVTFKRTDESAKIPNEMQSKTRLVKAIIFEVKDTERIRGNFLKSDSNVLCCNPKLAADRSCTVGEVIIKKDDDNPQWPIRIQTFFAGKEAEAKMTL